MRDPVDELIDAAKSAAVRLAQMDCDLGLEVRLNRAIRAAEQWSERRDADDMRVAKMTALGLVLIGADKKEA